MNVVLSIHDLTRRSTGVSLYNIQNQHIFQFTTSQGGRQRSIWKFYRMVIFQFTTSQGGRQYGGFRPVLKLDLSIHDLTRRSTIPFGVYIYSYATFNSRPHKEVDRSSDSLHCGSSSFNSRPHKEVDANAPAWVDLSGTFQFTTSQGGRPSVMRRRMILENFQFTTSQGGRLSDIRDHLRYYSLSIHDLTRRSTQQCILNRIHHVNFQFTTSQGGRRNLKSTALHRRTFQFTTSQGGRQKV